MNKLTSISFSKEYQKPIEEKDRQKGFIKWGKKNDYPFFLIEMLQGSAWHQGILKNKTYYIAGGGIQTVSGDASQFLNNSFADFDMNEIVQRMAFDFELFGAMAVIGTWNREGSRVVRWEYIGVDFIRMTEDERLYYVSDDWSAMQQNPETTNFRSYPALDEDNRSGSFLLYYKEPSKQSKGEKGIYPKPPYYGGITAIQTDVDISKFHMYELQNGFKAGTLINLASGYPETAEEERKIKDQIKGRTQSVEDAGEIIITFSNSAEEAPTVLPLSGNNLHERYQMTEKSVQQNILVAHSVVAPSLFGIAPNGSFNAAETAELFEIYKKTYVEARQKQIEWLLNYMSKLSGSLGVLKLADVKPIGVLEAAPSVQPSAAPVEQSMSAGQISTLIDIAASIKESKILPDAALEIILASFPTIDEAQARKIVGLPTTTLSSCDHKHEFSSDEIGIFSEYGLDASEYKVIKSEIIEWDTPADEVFKREEMMFATIGELQLILNDLDKNIISMLANGEDSTAIAQATGSTIEQIAQSIAKLTELGIYAEGQINDLGKQITEQKPAPVDRFQVVYSYQKRPDLPGPAKLPDGRTRDFCARLLEINRLFTRDDINSISSRVDRDVWRYRGGWYTNPDTGASTPYCRHIWVQQLVIKK